MARQGRAQPVRSWWVGPEVAADLEVPQTIAGLHGWYDASKITGLSGGVRVPQWDDSSGSGNHAVQGSGASQPTYETAVINGLPVVRFDGSNDSLPITNTDMLAMTNNAAGMTAIAVAKVSTAAAVVRQIFTVSSGSVATAVRFKFGQRATGSGVWATSVRRDDVGSSINVEG